jgi:hypothetical protein
MATERWPWITPLNEEGNMKLMVEVWGIAKGCNSTKEAARGALTWRHYEPDNVRKEDWLQIISIREVTTAK